MDLRSRIDIKVEINTLFVEKELNRVLSKQYQHIDNQLMRLLRELQEQKTMLKMRKY